MVTWKELRTAIRAELKDTNEEKYRWPDALLETYLQDALNDYSLWFPIRVDREELTLEEGTYTLPGDYVDSLFVECPQDRYLERRRPRQGIRYPSVSGRPFFYYTEGGSLYLNGSPLSGETVLLTYEALHAIPLIAEGDHKGEIDEDAELTIPTRDLELIRLYIMAKCYEQMRSRQAALDRFKDRASSGSDRQDNPLQPEVRSLMDEYDRKIALRYEGGSVRLHRTGRGK